MQELTPEQRSAKAIEARQFMDNPLFREMFAGVGEYLENAALSCDRKDEKMAADIIRCKQLLQAMKREIERKAEDGDFAAFELAQLEKQSVVRKILRR